MGDMKKEKVKENKVKYPATCVVHWPSGPVNACDQHARGIIALGNMLGSHMIATKIEGEAECSNCVSENPPLT